MDLLYLVGFRASANKGSQHSGLFGTCKGVLLLQFDAAVRTVVGVVMVLALLVVLFSCPAYH